MFRELGNFRQMFADLHPRHGRFDRREFTTVGVFRLGIESVQLAGTTGHPEDDALPFSLLALGNLLCQAWQPVGAGCAQGAQLRSAMQQRSTRYLVGHLQFSIGI